MMVPWLSRFHSNLKLGLKIVFDRQCHSHAMVIEPWVESFSSSCENYDSYLFPSDLEGAFFFFARGLQWLDRHPVEVKDFVF